MNSKELQIISDLVVKLTELRQSKCPQLCVENFATNCFGQLLGEYTMHKQGMIRLGE